MSGDADIKKLNVGDTAFPKKALGVNFCLGGLIKPLVLNKKCWNSKNEIEGDLEANA